MVHAGALILVLLGASVAPAPAADLASQAVAITGAVAHPQSLTLDDLHKLPSTTVQVSFLTDKGPMTGSFTGVLLSQVLSNAGVIDAPGKNAYLRHVYMVSGRDGYVVALSQGEIDSRYGGEMAILAFAGDGKTLDAGDGIRLVIPGDKHGGRAVRDVISIEVH